MSPIYLSPEGRRDKTAVLRRSIFSDECWAGGLRLAASPSVHYELVKAAIRRTLIN